MTGRLGLLITLVLRLGPLWAALNPTGATKLRREAPLVTLKRGEPGIRG